MSVIDFLSLLLKMQIPPVVRELSIRFIVYPKNLEKYLTQ